MTVPAERSLLFVVDAGQVAVHHRVIGGQVEGAQVGGGRPVEDARLLQHIAQVDVGVQEVGVERHRLLEVVDGQPYLALRVEHAAQVAPGHGEVGPRLDGLQVAALGVRWPPSVWGGALGSGCGSEARARGAGSGARRGGANRRAEGAAAPRRPRSRVRA